MQATEIVSELTNLVIKSHIDIVIYCLISFLHTNPFYNFPLTFRTYVHIICNWRNKHMYESRSIFDCTHVSALPVIASFSKEGKIQPLYIRIDGLSFKILTFVIRQSTAAGVSFECTVLDENLCKTIYLYYSLHEHAWFLSPNCISFK